MSENTANLEQLQSLLKSALGSDPMFIEVRDNGMETVLGGNRAGLLWLAAQLVSLSAKSSGSHIHVDAFSNADVSERPLVIQLSAGPEA